MYNIELIQAGHGDCIWIEYGQDKNSLHRILIDGGTSGTYQRIKKRIEKLPFEQRHFELLVITHIDADHIAGVLKLFEDASLKVSFDDVWFNGYQHLTELETLGAKQGEALTDHLDKAGRRWNKAFFGKAVRVADDGAFQPIVLPGGMKLTLLSPTKKELSELKPQWIKEAQKAGLDPQQRLQERNDIDTRPSGLEALGVKLPDVDILAEQDSETDASKANGSSIAFVAEFDARRTLFSGDAHDSVLLESIKKYCPDKQALAIDVFKIPHHGSDANVSRELLKHIQCNKYLISTNGAYFKHPDDIAIARIIKYGGNEPEIYFNYCSKYNQIWGNRMLMDKYSYRVFYPHEEDTGISLLL